MNTHCIDEIPFWIPFDGFNLPKNATKAGKEFNQNLFVGRAEHSGSVTPGKVYEHARTCVLPWGCIANTKTEYEVLVGSINFNWVAAADGEVPANAFPGGFSEQGETLYIGRILHQGQLIVGKIQPSHRVLYIAFEESELNFNRYEVLVV